MEAAPNFKFKQSSIFSNPDEVSELYKLFKVIDDSNDGRITEKEVDNFMITIYKADNVDLDACRIADYYDRAHQNSLDFDTFIEMMEHWFVYTGAAKFSSDRTLKDMAAMTEDTWQGFHSIIKAFFYENQFTYALKLIEEGKEKYQDLENSILDMNSKGEFARQSIEVKGSSLELSKAKFLSFSDVLRDFSTDTNIDLLNEGLKHILDIFEVLDWIVIDFEMQMIKSHIHSIFGCLINTNMFENFVKILDLSLGTDSAVAKICTLKILCHVSKGLKIFTPNEDAHPLYPDEGYYSILSSKLNDPELLLNLKRCVESSWVEVVEQACITLGYFVMNDLEFAEALNQLGIIKALLSITSSEQIVSINEYSMWCIFNICRKYLAEADKIAQEQEDDPIYNIAFQVGQLMYTRDFSERSTFWYMILSWGYLIPLISHYNKEVKALCDKLIEFLNSDDVTLVNWWIRSMARAIMKDAHLIGYFNEPSAVNAIQNRLLSPNSPDQLRNILIYLNYISLENVLTFDDNLINAFYYVHQSQTKNSKDVVRIFKNIIKTTGAKQLVRHSKDIIKFAYESFDSFKNDNDKVIKDQYHQKEVITIDIVYFLSCLELMHWLNDDITQEVLLDHLTTEKVHKLEDVIAFYYECYHQWHLESTNMIDRTEKYDSVIVECTNMMLDMLKEIGLKLVSGNFNGFNRDRNYIALKDKLEDYVQLLETQMNGDGPVESDHRFFTDFIWVKVHDLQYTDNREFEMTPDVNFEEFEREIMDRFKMEFPLLQYEDDRRDKITIDSEYSFQHALNLAVDISKSNRLDQVIFDIFLSEKPGYIVKWRRWRKNFLSDTRYGNYQDEYCEDCTASSNYRRSTTPVMNRTYTQAGYNTPAARNRYGGGNYTRASTNHRTFTPMRGSYSTLR